MTWRDILDFISRCAARLRIRPTVPEPLPENYIAVEMYDWHTHVVIVDPSGYMVRRVRIGTEHFVSDVGCCLHLTDVVDTIKAKMKDTHIAGSDMARRMVEKYGLQPARGVIRTSKGSRTLSCDADLLADILVARADEFAEYVVEQVSDLDSDLPVILVGARIKGLAPILARYMGRTVMLGE